MAELDSGADVSFEDLVVRVARARDRSAFRILFVTFAPRIKQFMLRLGASEAVAEDLAQEAMLSIWRKAALFDPGKASATTWIFAIARNLRIDVVRRERRPDFEADFAPVQPDAQPSADAEPALAIMRKDDGRRLQSALASLPAEQAQIVDLSYFADKTHSAIADELGLPLGTVKSRLRLAMTRLRAAWETRP